LDTLLLEVDTVRLIMYQPAMADREVVDLGLRVFREAAQ
jgi:hypothetical protein